MYRFAIGDSFLLSFFIAQGYHIDPAAAALIKGVSWYVVANTRAHTPAQFSHVQHSFPGLLFLLRQTSEEKQIERGRMTAGRSNNPLPAENVMENASHPTACLDPSITLSLPFFKENCSFRHSFTPANKINHL